MDSIQHERQHRINTKKMAFFSEMPKGKTEPNLPRTEFVYSRLVSLDSGGYARMWGERPTTITGIEKKDIDDLGVSLDVEGHVVTETARDLLEKGHFEMYVDLLLPPESNVQNLQVRIDSPSGEIVMRAPFSDNRDEINENEFPRLTTEERETLTRGMSTLSVDESNPDGTKSSKQVILPKNMLPYINVYLETKEVTQ